MGTRYEPGELDDQFKKYDTLKESVRERVVEEIGGPDDPGWERTNLWDYAQDEYFDFEYDTLEDLAKFADAAYYRVEENIDDPDWSDVKDRIVNFVLPRHVDVRRKNDFPEYLPGSYTSLATQEIVVHAVTLELVQE